MGLGGQGNGNEFVPTRGAKLVSGDARINNMANETEHIRLDRKDPASPSAHPPTAAAPRALAAIVSLYYFFYI